MRTTKNNNLSNLKCYSYGAYTKSKIEKINERETVHIRQLLLVTAFHYNYYYYNRLSWLETWQTGRRTDGLSIKIG